MGTVNQEERISALDEQVSLKDDLIHHQQELISKMEEAIHMIASISKKMLRHTLTLLYIWLSLMEKNYSYMSKKCK